MMRKRTSFFIKIPEIKVILSEAFFLVYAYFQAHCSHHEGHEEHEEDWKTKHLTALSYTFLLKLV